MLSFVKTFAWKEIGQGLEDSPELLDYRDEKGRNLLHLTCSVNLKRNRELKDADSVKLAGLLIERGLDASKPAFRRGEWSATPLWHAISRGENIELATYLLDVGCDPNHCLWAAVFRNDTEAIRLLVGHGAEIDPVYEDGTIPFLVAAKGGPREAAETLLDLGANPDHQDPSQRAALHWILQGSGDPRTVSLLLAHGASGDIEDETGRTAHEILQRKRDTALRKPADEYFTSWLPRERICA